MTTAMTALRQMIPFALVSFASLGGVVAFALASSQTDPPAAEPAARETRPTPKQETTDVPTETATFAAGCFWGVQLRFDQTDGVVETEVGYTGGHKDNPTYRDVCYTDTGHAEAVRVEFDPSVVSYETLLDVFWHGHDPTTKDRQGPDVGSQYRSAIFFHSEAQKQAAEASREAIQRTEDYQKTFGDRPIVTEIVPAPEWFKAEEYHQDYLVKHGRATCHPGWGTPAHAKAE
jgi:peptide-methionine (S)-S-oxide reductase